MSEHKCKCRYIGCHINDCRRWCHFVNKEIPYEFCNEFCIAYDERPTQINLIQITMTQEDKTPLLKDLYAKSLYGIHCCVYNLNGTIREEDDIIYYCADTNVVTLKSSDKNECYMYYQIKPYLRLLSSITKKEKDKLIDLGLGYIDSGRYEDENGVKIYIGESFQFIPCFELYDWFNSHFFDYRGLIEKDLALEAPEGMYNIKEK